MTKIAIFQDYLAQMGGAERVTEAIHRMLPQSDLITTMAVPERLSEYLGSLPIRTTWMQALPAKSKWYRHYFLLYPFGVELAPTQEYDLIISSCCGYSKGVKRRNDAVHVCYCHTPLRWVWRMEDYMKREKFNPLAKLSVAQLAKAMKFWEKRAARRPDYFIANSSIVAGRLRAAFGVEATVIEPPIDTSRFNLSSETEDYYLVLSRLVAYKRLDLAVEACRRTGRRLVLIGDGTDRGRLQALAGPTVTFLGRQPDEVVNHYASRCQALILPGEEDFGMTPLEMNAAGRPVVAYRAGGATETVIEGLNGIFFAKQSVDSLIDALERCESHEWQPAAIRRHAQRYDIRVFQERMMGFLRNVAPNIQESAQLEQATARVNA